MRMHPLAVAATLVAAVSALACPALAASPRLTGPTRMKILQPISFHATGLRPGSYALFITKSIERGARTYRCVAYLSAPREVTQTSESFYGSVPNRAECHSGGPSPTHHSRSTPLGRYQLQVCSPVVPGHCSPQATVLRKVVRIRA